VPPELQRQLSDMTNCAKLARAVKRTTLMKPQHAAEGAALVFLAEATFAVVHRISGGEYGRFTHVHNVVIDIGLAAIWLGAAAAVMVRRGFPIFFLAMVGAAVSLIHGLMFSVASPGTGVGIPFMVACVVIAFLLKRSVPAWDTTTAAPVEAAHAPRWRFLRPRHA
jgi:hypothetical protein